MKQHWQINNVPLDLIVMVENKALNNVSPTQHYPIKCDGSLQKKQNTIIS